MVENKWILNKLMSDNADALDSLWEESGSDNDKMMTASRVVQVRYRFYAVWILLCIFLLFFWFIIPSWDTYKSKKSEIQNAKWRLEALEAREDQYNQSIWFLETVQENDAKIVSCVNYEETCQALPQEVQDKFWLARSYLLTNWMNETKMDVDERKIIENIDRFLVKFEPFLNNSTINWEISKISIWDKIFNDWLYTVPVQVNITFEDKKYLLSFINNVEQYIPEDEDIRVLYKIDKISYDIINSDQPQNTSIYMNLYYYDE